MNYMEQVASMLGIEFQTEQFEVLEIPGDLFTIDFCGTRDQTGRQREFLTTGLLTGAYTIKKLPWIPKECEAFYKIWEEDIKGYAKCINYCKESIELMHKRGVTFYKTEEEVKAAVKELGWEVE